MQTHNFEFLWILDSQGKVYVQRSFDRSLTTQIKDMYSCLLSSLTVFSSNVYNASCDRFCVGNKTVLMKPYPKFQVVLSVNEKADDVKSLDQLLKILDEAIANNHPESITIKRILDFLDNLTDYKLELLINNIGDNLKLILNNAKGLSSLQKNRYKKII